MSILSFDFQISDICNRCRDFDSLYSFSTWLLDTCVGWLNADNMSQPKISDIVIDEVGSHSSPAET